MKTLILALLHDYPALSATDLSLSGGTAPPGQH
jgi:hypothetical protein